MPRPRDTLNLQTVLRFIQTKPSVMHLATNCVVLLYSNRIFMKLLAFSGSLSAPAEMALFTERGSAIVLLELNDKDGFLRS